MAGPSTCRDVPFNNISAFLQHCSTAKRAKKEEALRKFRRYSVPRTADDIFEVYRLLLPKMDAKRGNYHLKEGKLAPLLVEACGLNAAKSHDAQQAIGWKKAGVRGAGNFVGVMEAYLLRKNCGLQDGDARQRNLTVGDVNNRLDKLAATESREEQVAILRLLLHDTTPTQMKWLLAIILKDVKVGMSDERILKDFHPDAEALYNMTMDLERVTRELADPNKRMPRRDVEPLQPIRPQLCKRANSLEDAFSQMKGKPFVSEVKFDGVRMQVHITPQEVRYFSRRGREHGDYYRCTIFDTVLRQQVRHTTCILDGEMVVWNKARCEFMPFGGFRSAMNAAGDNVPPDALVSMADHGSINTAKADLLEPPLAKEVEVVYICFDMLFMGDESIINRPLQERLQLLKDAVVPAPSCGILLAPSEVICGRVVPLLPDECLPGLGPDPYSKVSSSLADLQDMYNRAVARQEEGVVVKALNSSWVINDRSGAWLKVKPDYLENVEVDCLVIGGYYGTGRNGGQISEYLLALAEEPAVPTAAPSRWVSFTRVGTGMSDEDREMMQQRLAPVLAASAKAPHYYRVTGTAKERPDAWVTDPTRSIVLTVKSDVRMIVSKVYAADYSLRFPRVEAVRLDKDASCVNTDQELREQVLANQGTITAMKARMTAEGMLGAAEGAPPGLRRGRKGAGKKGQAGAQRGGVPLHLRPVDVSGVEVEVNLLQGAEVCILNYAPKGTPPQQARASKQQLYELVKKMGGVTTEVPRFSKTAYVVTEVMDQRDQTVRSLIADGDAGRRTYDIISTAWLRESYAAQELLPILPRHYLYITSATRHRSAGIDIHGDPYFTQVSPEDVQQLLEVLMDKGRWAKAQREWADAEQRQEAAEAAEGAAAAEPEESAATPDQVLISVQQQLQQLPQAAQQQGMEGARRALLLGCTMLLVGLQPGLSSSSPAGGTAIDSSSPSAVQHQQQEEQPLLMDGEEAARAAAAKWRAVMQQQQLSDLELQVMAHGGQVVKSYSSKVNHVILYDPAALEAHAAPPAAAGASTLTRSKSSMAALQPDAIAAGTIIASLHHQLLRAATPSSNTQQVQHAGSSDRAAAQAAAVLGSAGVSTPDLSTAVATMVEGGARGRAAMSQLAQQVQGPGASVPPGAGCSPASQQAAASVLKQLRRIRRRLATGRLHLVNSAWLTDTLTSAAAEGPGALRRKPELLYTPLVLRQALSSARQASAAAASSDVGPAAGGAGQHGGHEPPATSGVQQSGGVWSWPWELVGLGDTTGSSSDSDGGSAKKAPQGRRSSTGRKSDGSRATTARRRRARSQTPTAAPDADQGQEQQQGLSGTTAGSRPKRASRKRGASTAAAAAAAAAAAGDVEEEQEEEEVAPKRRRAAGKGSRRRAGASSGGSDEDHVPVVKVEAPDPPAEEVHGPLKRLKRQPQRQAADAAADTAGSGGGAGLEDVIVDTTQQQQMQQEGEVLGSSFSQGSAAAGSGSGRGRKLPRLPPLAGSVSAAPTCIGSQAPSLAGAGSSWDKQTCHTSKPVAAAPTAAAGGAGGVPAAGAVGGPGSTPALLPAVAAAAAAPTGSGPGAVEAAGSLPAAAGAVAVPRGSRLLRGLLAALGEEALAGVPPPAAGGTVQQPPAAQRGDTQVAAPPAAAAAAAAAVAVGAGSALGAATSQGLQAAAGVAPRRGRFVANMLSMLDGDAVGGAAGAPVVPPPPAAASLLHAGAGGAGSSSTQSAAAAAPGATAAAEGAPAPTRKKASIRGRVEALLKQQPQ